MLILVASFGWVDLDQANCRADDPVDLCAFDVELERRAAGAVDAGQAAALTGWVPARLLEQLAGDVAAVGGLVVVLAKPRRLRSPALHRRRHPDGSVELVCGRPASVSAPANVAYRHARRKLAATLARLRVRLRGRRRGRPAAPVRPESQRAFQPWRLPYERHDPTGALAQPEGAVRRAAS